MTCWWHHWHFDQQTGDILSYYTWRMEPHRSRCQYNHHKLVKITFYKCCRCGKKKEKRG